MGHRVEVDAAGDTRQSLTAWKLADGSLLVTNAGDPFTVIPALRSLEATPVPDPPLKHRPRKKAPAKKRKGPALREKDSTGGGRSRQVLICADCRKEFPENRSGRKAKRCPACRGGTKKVAARGRTTASPMATILPPVPATARPSVKITIPRRCEECGVRTEENPCHHCQAPWNRGR